jgi:hypothetical protein
VLSSVAALLWGTAVLLTATYYVPDAAITYTTKLTWSHTVDLAPRVGWHELKSTLGVYDVGFWASLVVVVAAAIRAGAPYGRRTILALASPVILLFPLNAMACLALAVDVLFLEPYDGEFLAEGWPQNYVYAVWTLGAALLAWKAARAGAPGPQNNQMQLTAPAQAMERRS